MHVTGRPRELLVGRPEPERPHLPPMPVGAGAGGQGMGRVSQVNAPFREVFGALGAFWSVSSHPQGFQVTPGRFKSLQVTQVTRGLQLCDDHRTVGDVMTPFTMVTDSRRRVGVLVRFIWHSKSPPHLPSPLTLPTVLRAGALLLEIAPERQLPILRSMTNRDWAFVVHEPMLVDNLLPGSSRWRLGLG